MLKNRKMISLYDKIGRERLEEIVKVFYSKVFESEIIGHLFQNDRILIQEKQLKFLTQFLGGPQLYTIEFGHPKMRMRHLPHLINEEGKEEWLRCMKQAIFQVIDQDKDLANDLYNCFPHVAQHMVNR